MRPLWGGRIRKTFGEIDIMKTQMKVQKYLMLATLIISALTVVYALIFFSGSLSDIYINMEPTEVKYGTIFNPQTTTFDINATHFYEVAQAFNSAMFIISVVFVCVTVTLYITSCNKRRNYYITNYISTIAVALFAVVFAIYGIVMLSYCLNIFCNEINWTQYLAKYNFDQTNAANNYVYDPTGSTPRQFPYYSDSKALFVIGYVLFFIVLIAGVALVLNLIWKIKLMQGEKQLLANGFNKEVA
jgi:hypothetical protein